MKHIVDGDIVLSQPPDAPLAAEIEAFAEWARGQGYARYSRYRKVLLASCFSRWLKKQAIRLRGISCEHTSRYLRSRARRVRRRKGDAAALTAFLEFLRRRDILGAEKRPSPRLTAVQRATPAFEQYLRHERALAPATVVHYIPFIHRFLTDRFGHGPVRLSRLRARDVARFVQRQAPRVHLKEAKVLTAALRSFLRYARYRGVTPQDLAGAVPSVANWSMPSGRKERCTPLAKPIIAVSNAWLREPPRGDEQVLFPTARGTRLSADAVQYLQVQLGIKREECLVAPRPMAVARDLHGPHQRLERTLARPRVRPLDAIGADDRRRRGGLCAQIEVRLQQLPHPLAPLLLEHRFQIAVPHARSIRRLQAPHQSEKAGFRRGESVGGIPVPHRRAPHPASPSPDLWSGVDQRCHSLGPFERSDLSKVLILRMDLSM
ncbi:MAG: site-specific integrase [Acidobacteria bacterium]|nr:site-specific integrase [Acidobacteriota bacterium]